MEDEAVDEAPSDAVSKPREVPCGVGARCRVGLYLERQEIAPAEFGDDVDFMATVFLAHVVEAGPSGADGQLGTKLGDDERIE